jgi:sugar lactone lactonase YvrE
MIVDLEAEPFGGAHMFGEGMRWFRNRIWLSDMLARTVYAYDAAGTSAKIATVPGRPNGLGFLPDGRLVVTSMADQKLLVRAADGSLRQYADLSGLMTGYCGDMAVDTVGRIYLDDVGYRVFEGEERKPGRLILVQPDGSSRVLLDRLAFPNGMWITRDQRRLIFAEGRASTLYSFELATDGGFADQKIFARLDSEVLDGLTLDDAGGVWQCLPHDRELLRIVDGGDVTHRIKLPLQPIACCLGGDALRTLYVVAADYTLERMARDDTWARLYAVTVDIPGFLLPGDAIGG